MTRIVAYTPYGRERTVSVLLPYMRRDHERGLLAEWMLCMNTGAGQGGDVAYAHELAAACPWIRLYERPGPEGWHGRFPVPHHWRDAAHPVQRNSHRFFAYMTDEDTTYLRFDDDIVYVHEDAVERMAESARRPEVLASFPVIINNAIVSWHLQQQGRLPESVGRVGSAYCMDPAGWSDGGFAHRLHSLALDHIEAGTARELFLYVGVQLERGQQFSISAFAVRGAELAAVQGVTENGSPDDEAWLTMSRPGETGLVNVIVPDALVSHFSFYPHRDFLLGTDVLDRYRKLAAAL